MGKSKRLPAPKQKQKNLPQKNPEVVSQLARLFYGRAEYGTIPPEADSLPSLRASCRDQEGSSE
jgi:hypothetical protein